MIRNIRTLRFVHPEPPQLRANALSGLMRDGDEGYRITYDDVVGMVHFTKPGITRACHVSACAWLEWPNDVPASATKK
jgi:hypothetical protein